VLATRLVMGSARLVMGWDNRWSRGVFSAWGLAFALAAMVLGVQRDGCTSIWMMYFAGSCGSSLVALQARAESAVILSQDGEMIV
jgi:hypothetical protein